MTIVPCTTPTWIVDKDGIVQYVVAWECIGGGANPVYASILPTDLMTHDKDEATMESADRRYYPAKNGIKS